MSEQIRTDMEGIWNSMIVKGQRGSHPWEIQRGVYVLRNKPGTMMKIGMSKEAPKRVKNLQNSSADELYLYGTIPGQTRDQEVELERDVHAKLWHYRQHGEWFELCNDSVIDLIKMARDCEGHIDLSGGFSVLRGCRQRPLPRVLTRAHERYLRWEFEEYGRHLSGKDSLVTWTHLRRALMVRTPELGELVKSGRIPVPKEGLFYYQDPTWEREELLGLVRFTPKIKLQPAAQGALL